MNASAPAELCDSIRPERVKAIEQFGFTERQARFLVNVLLHSGVFLERQYCRFAGITHGRKTYEFLHSLIDRKYATVMMPGKLHSGRLYHVQYKPLYDAIGEPDNRNRRPVAVGRLIERLMLLDVILADKDHTWLATERDKLAYFRARRLWDSSNNDNSFPRLAFGEGTRRVFRYFPDKLPIGLERSSGGRGHLFVYLVRQFRADDFRVFLARHAELLHGCDEWTIRIVLARRFAKAKSLHLWAFRDDLVSPVKYGVVDELEWYFRSKHGRDLTNVKTPDLTMKEAAEKFGSGRYRALERLWLQEGYNAIGGIESHTLKDKCQLGRGRVQVMVLPHQYLQLTSLVGVA
jgi:hypothetical protein